MKRDGHRLWKIPLDTANQIGKLMRMISRLAFLRQLQRDLDSPIEVRGFGSGWFAGFFALLFAVIGFGLVAALRFPAWFAMPELQTVKEWSGFRALVHGLLLASYALALLGLLLRPRKFYRAWRGNRGGAWRRRERQLAGNARLGHLLRARFLDGQSARDRADVCVPRNQQH